MSSTGERTSLTVQLRLARLAEVHGRLLRRRSRRRALESALLSGAATLAAGGAATVWVLRAVPGVVTVVDGRVVLELVGAVFALTVTVGVAAYAGGRFRHALTIPAVGRVGMVGPALLLAALGAGGAVLGVEPWGFPAPDVIAVPTLVVGEYLAQHQVAGGLVIYDGTVPVAYLRTTAGRWVDAVIPAAAVDAVDVGASVRSRHVYTPQGIALRVGAAQLAALRDRTVRSWTVVAVVAAAGAALTAAQRRRWRSAPSAAPLPGDTRDALARAHAGPR